MSEHQPLVVDFIHYGISPWESEVAYGYFNSKFTVKQKEIDPDEADSEFVSFIGLTIPVQFSEEFFKWFEFRRWEKVKALFKEMKRRRGSGNALKIEIIFKARPSIRFVVDVHDKQWFGNAIEKMDFVLELIQYHLVPEKLPEKTRQITYKFDSESIRWKLYSAEDMLGAQYLLKNDTWKKSTDSADP